MYPLDGAAGRPGNGDTAWAWRDAAFAQVFVGAGTEPGRDEELRAWSVGFSDAIRPHALGGAYSNFMMDEGPERARAAFRGNYERLQQVKAWVDPGNLFHVNQNVVPVA
jgi:hypothetical protein